MTPVTRTAHPARQLPVADTVLAAAGEAVLLATYASQDAVYHWLAHLLAGGTAAKRSERPARPASNKPASDALPPTEPNEKIRPAKDPPMLFDSPRISIAKSETRHSKQSSFMTANPMRGVTPKRHTDERPPGSFAHAMSKSTIGGPARNVPVDR